MTPPTSGRPQASTSLADGTAKRRVFPAFLIGCEGGNSTQTGNLRGLPGSRGRGYPQETVQRCARSVTDLYEEVPGTSTKDTSPVGGRGGRQAGREAAAAKSALRTAVPGWLR